jgi:hypothetical protein
MNPKLPLNKRWVEVDKQGRNCVVAISIEQTADKLMYPPSGIKSVFKVIREKNVGTEDYEIVYLIDNHEPFGFHEHPKLPADRETRRIVHASSWDEAWVLFEKKIEEILDET